jgi:hypothetical protein
MVSRHYRAALSVALPRAGRAPAEAMRAARQTESGSTSKRKSATRPQLWIVGAAAMLLATAARAQPIGAVPIAPPAPPAIALASHRAVYDVSLVRASQRDGVRGARGTMTYALTDRCDGYTIESQMHLDMGLANGADSELDQRYAAWEAKDNRSATFRMLVRENGHVKDSYHGTVTLDGAGAGRAVYSGDQDVTYDLPAGTLLSTAHLAALLQAAARGETFVNRPVIDGSFDDGPYRVGGVIGPSKRARVPAGGAADLAAGPAWPLALAYFQLDSDQDTPDYELVMNVGANGVARHLVQDFGGFTLAFELLSAEPLAGPPC